MNYTITIVNTARAIQYRQLPIDGNLCITIQQLLTAATPTHIPFNITPELLVECFHQHGVEFDHYVESNSSVLLNEYDFYEINNNNKFTFLETVLRCRLTDFIWDLVLADNLISNEAQREPQWTMYGERNTYIRTEEK